MCREASSRAKDSRVFTNAVHRNQPTHRGATNDCMRGVVISIVCFVDEGSQLIHDEFEVVVAVDGVVKHIGLILSFRLHDGRLFFVGERFIDLLRKVV